MAMSNSAASAVAIEPLAVTTEDAAAMIGRRPKTLANWRTRGFGPRFVRAEETGPVVYLVADLRAWLEANRVDPAA